LLTVGLKIFQATSTDANQFEIVVLSNNSYIETSSKTYKTSMEEYNDNFTKDAKLEDMHDLSRFFK
jgi:hypothetical protein